MKRLPILFAAVLGAFLLTAGMATAKDDKNTAKHEAKQACKAEKKADKQAFEATYGKSAMRTCVKGEKSEAKSERRESKQACRDEREADGDAFAETHGSNKNKKNAFGKCVSAKMEEEQDSDEEAFKNAAKECKAERGTNRDAFRETYGSNENKRNAFGKCVSSKAGEMDSEDEPGDEEEGEEDPSDDGEGEEPAPETA